MSPRTLSTYWFCAAALLAFMLACQIAIAGPREQAKRIHDRIAGVPPNATVLDEMANAIANGPGDTSRNAHDAAFIAMQNPDFFRVTLKNFATPWTNRDHDIYAALNDYTATVIGMVRDDIDFRQVLSGNIIYVGASGTGVPPYSTTDNRHYESLDEQGVDLKANLVQRTQTEVTGLPAEATAGILTTRAAAKAYFINGTNRAMFRFTLVNFLCRDMEQVSDITRPPDRIRQDVTRSPGGDSRLFRNNCIGCHSGMDPMAQAFAYYDFVDGHLVYNSEGMLDPLTGERVVHKYHINQNNFPYGYITHDDSWVNYWRSGPNQRLGWDPNLPGKGSGAKSLGQEFANSEAFADCQVTRVFRAVCLRSPVSAPDKSEITTMVGSFKASGYRLKQSFADAAAYCMGD